MTKTMADRVHVPIDERIARALDKWAMAQPRPRQRSRAAAARHFLLEAIEAWEANEAAARGLSKAPNA